MTPSQTIDPREQIVYDALNETRVFFHPPDPERELRVKAKAVLDALADASYIVAHISEFKKAD